MDRLSSRIEMTEKMIMKLEDSSIEIIQSEKQREKRLKKKKEKNFRTWGTITKVIVIQVPEGEEKDYSANEGINEDENKWGDSMFMDWKIQIIDINPSPNWLIDLT